MSLMKRIFSTESTGKRLSIAFLDTGISPVADFILPENRILAFRDFINGRTEPYDDNGVTGHMSRHPKNEIPALDILLSCYPSSRHPFHHPIKRSAEQQGKHNPKYILRHTKPHCTLETVKLLCNGKRTKGIKHCRQPYSAEKPTPIPPRIPI